MIKDKCQGATHSLDTNLKDTAGLLLIPPPSSSSQNQNIHTQKQKSPYCPPSTALSPLKKKQKKVNNFITTTFTLFFESAIGYEVVSNEAHL